MINITYIKNGVPVTIRGKLIDPLRPPTFKVQEESTGEVIEIEASEVTLIQEVKPCEE